MEETVTPTTSEEAEQIAQAITETVPAEKQEELQEKIEELAAEPTEEELATALYLTKYAGKSKTERSLLALSPVKRQTTGGSPKVGITRKSREQSKKARKQEKRSRKINRK